MIRSLHAASALERAYCTETRPYNQGSRLTAYELVHDGIPATLIADSMAGALFGLASPRRYHGPHQPRTKSIPTTTSTEPQEQGDDAGVRARASTGDGNTTGSTANSRETPLAAVIVGADRVAANGDTANKVGTYSLGVLARHHGVPFVVAAPRSTIDLRTSSGTDIVIEQRPAHELGQVAGALVDASSEHPTNRGQGSGLGLEPHIGRVHGLDEGQGQGQGQGHGEGKREGKGGEKGQGQGQDDGDSAKQQQQQQQQQRLETVSVAAPGIDVWNPAFDVTPAALIDAIVTEVGVVEKGPDGFFDFGDVFTRTRAA